jgi:alpha-glucoside transport system permease protein
MRILTAAISPYASILPSLLLLFLGLLVFGVLVALIFVLAERTKEKTQNRLKYAVFLGPAVILLIIGLIYPAIRTLFMSFFDANSSQFIGLDNYIWTFTRPEILLVLRNTVIWTVVVPLASTSIGLGIAYLTDRMKYAGLVKSLIFMPMAISFVGASIIWKFVYNFQPNPTKPDIGLLSAVVKAFGGTPPNWLLTTPLNTFLLIAVMVWIQTGFAMIVLSAAMKAIPDDVVEASMLDGATGWSRFTRITVPMIWSSVIVVLTTITVTSLKVFDIIRTMTGGNFQTSVIANEMYNQSFTILDYGKGGALAIVLFLGVLPLIIYNLRQVRNERAIS